MAGQSGRSRRGRSNSAIYKDRRSRRGFRRMARSRRGVPILRLSAGLVIVAGLMVGWLWHAPRSHRSPDPGPPEAVTTLANTWRAGPGEVVAFADTMARQSVETLAGLGIPRDVIDVKMPRHFRDVSRVVWGSTGEG